MFKEAEMTSVRPIGFVCEIEDIAPEHLSFGSYHGFDLPVPSQAYGSAQHESENGLMSSMAVIV
jgi:hypothetical protein